MERLSLILLVLVIFSFVFFSLVKALVSSTTKEFSLQPEVLYLNWTNGYQTNLTINSTSSITLIFDNSTSVAANYSQGLGVNLRLKNNTGELDNTNFINTSKSNFTNFTIIAFLDQSKPGRYESFFTIYNLTNSSENASVKVIIDVPIEIDSSTGTGEFNGSLPPNATYYHSFYFNCSDFPNATSITINISFNGDLDLFLLADDYLIAKSIGNENEEMLTYSFIDPNATYEIRVYGSSISSNISYNGSVAVLSLSSSQEGIDFGEKNVSLNATKITLDLKNEGNIPIENVNESLEFYYSKLFEGEGAKNFTFFLPNSSVFERVKVRLIWADEGAYNLSLFNSSGIEVGKSFEKHVNANMSKVEKEEFVEVNNSDKAGWWRVEVKNITVNFSPYQLIIQAFANASKWIKTNFSDYENKTFDVVGSENSTKTIEVNLTTPVDAITGRYEGFLVYSAKNGGQIKIPVWLELNNILNVSIVELVNETVNVSSQPAYVNVSFLIAYVDDTKISPLYSPLDFTKNMSVWLYEPNASYFVRNLSFVNISNSTHWKINLTIPAEIPGGRYFTHINLTSYAYQGESLEDATNKLLIVDDVGLYMSLISFPPTLSRNSSGYVNVSIKNLGPENASNVKVKIFKGNCLSGAYFYLSDCNKYPNPGEEVTFNISAFNYTGCHIVWRVVGGSNETSCTSWINGTVGSWFRNISFETSVYIEPTTTTTLPNITLPTTTTSSTTTTTTTSSTTTTTIPAQQVASESIKISRISPDTPATINIPLIETFKIQRMTIFVNKNVSNVVLNLKEGSKPEGVPPPLKDDEGVVLKYLEISATNISNSDIVNVTMEFQVEKSWVDKNNIDSNTIFLYRYSNNTWNMLQTKKINETMNYYYFNSVSPGFSLFAIAGYKARGLPNWVFYLVVGIIVAAILAFLFWPVKEKKEEVKIDIPYKMEKEKEETKKPWDELKKKWEEIKKKWELKEKKSS